MPSPSEFLIRAAKEADVPLIAEINKHYVENTVLTFVEEAPSEKDVLAKYSSIVGAGYPCIVAVPRDDDNNPIPSTGVLGYAWVKEFRDGMGAYRHTVELTLFCHPSHQGNGVGSALLAALLATLRDPASNRHLLPTESSSESSAATTPGPLRGVKHVIAVMAVDSEGKRAGLALKEFYEGFGFVMRGHLKEVGYKFGRWIDTMYLQLTL